MNRIDFSNPQNLLHLTLCLVEIKIHPNLILIHWKFDLIGIKKQKIENVAINILWNSKSRPICRFKNEFNNFASFFAQKNILQLLTNRIREKLEKECSFHLEVTFQIFNREKVIEWWFWSNTCLPQDVKIGKKFLECKTLNHCKKMNIYF